MNRPGTTSAELLVDVAVSACLSRPRYSQGGVWKNWDQIEGNWKQFKGRVRSKWAKLTDDDVELTKGKRDALVGRIQERYGTKRDDAERQIDDWISHL